MIRVGSRANTELLNRRKNSIIDHDFMCTEKELSDFLSTIPEHEVLVSTEKSYSLKHNDTIYEFFIAKDNNSTEQLLQYCNNVHSTVQDAKDAPIEVLYLLKMSHRYLRNSPHFIKTMRDIHELRKQGAVLNQELEDILVLREKETYDYKHPDLNVSKNDFFAGDGVDYIYDHDTIHAAIAIGSSPAYTKYIKEDSEVLTSKEKFFSVTEYTRLLGVYEEACVLALERSQIPYVLEGTRVSDTLPTPKDSFLMALIKVCTSITSGWFRHYAWENFYKVVDMYRGFGEDDYVNRFTSNKNMLRKFDG